VFQYSVIVVFNTVFQYSVIVVFMATFFRSASKMLLK